MLAALHGKNEAVGKLLRARAPMEAKDEVSKRLKITGWETHVYIQNGEYNNEKRERKLQRSNDKGYLKYINKI